MTIETNIMCDCGGGDANGEFDAEAFLTKETDDVTCPYCGATFVYEDGRVVEVGWNDDATMQRLEDEDSEFDNED